MSAIFACILNIGIIVLLAGSMANCTQDDFVKEAAGDKTCRKGYQKIEEKDQCIYASDVLGYIYEEKNQEEGICWFDQTTNSSQYGAKDIPSNKEHLICIGYDHKEDTTCKNHYGGVFHDREDAFNHCQNSPSCGGIFNVHCANEYFHLCPIDSEMPSGDNDCLDSKKECEDIDAVACKKFKEQGFCLFHDGKCNKTCGGCGQNACYDKGGMCRDIDVKEDCSAKYVRERCPKKCGVCSGKAGQNTTPSYKEKTSAATESTAQTPPVIETYRKEKSKFCYGIYDSFKTLSDAETECTKNPNCTMIYDIDCAGIGYNVCEGDSDDSIDSCVYVKANTTVAQNSPTTRIAKDCDESEWGPWQDWESCKCWGGVIECGRTYRKRIRPCKRASKECSCKGNMVEKEMDCDLP